MEDYFSTVIYRWLVTCVSMLSIPLLCMWLESIDIRHADNGNKRSIKFYTFGMLYKPLSTSHRDVQPRFMQMDPGLKKGDGMIFTGTNERLSCKVH